MTYFIGSHKKKPDRQEYDNLVGFLDSEIALAQRRVDALKRTKELNPDWKYFDQYADDYKTIGILIDEWEVILWALGDDQKKLDAKMFAPTQGVLI